MHKAILTAAALALSAPLAPALAHDDDNTIATTTIATALTLAFTTSSGKRTSARTRKALRAGESTVPFIAR